MHTGEKLGAALRSAMEAKGVKQAAVAAEFHIAQPSVSEWIKFGRIAKKHIPHLVAYFADVVGPEHWGLPADWGAARKLSQAAVALAEAYDRMKPAEQHRLRLLMLAARDGVHPSNIKPAPNGTPSRDASTPVDSFLGGFDSGIGGLDEIPAPPPSRKRGGR